VTGGGAIIKDRGLIFFESSCAPQKNIGKAHKGLGSKEECFKVSLFALFARENMTLKITTAVKERGECISRIPAQKGWGKLILSKAPGAAKKARLDGHTRRKNCGQARVTKVNQRGKRGFVTKSYEGLR